MEHDEQLKRANQLALESIISRLQNKNTTNQEVATNQFIEYLKTTLGANKHAGN